MNFRARLSVGAVLLCVLAPAIRAQAPQDKPLKEAANKSKPAKTEEPDPLAAERRSLAVSLLTSLADDARSFRDQKLRARVVARAADALWTSEPDRSRDLFRRAWDAAEAGDVEATRLASEDARKQQQQTGMIIRRGTRDMRSEVLRLVAKRDRKLAEEFLKKLEEAADREAKDAATDANLRRGMDQWSAPAAEAKRIALARALLQDGDVERALQYAGPAILDHVNKDTIGFLSALRQQNPQAADTAFASLLARSAQDPSSDANTVAGLSSYAFTPLLYITFSADGGSFANQEGPLTGPPDLSPALRASFFQVAAGILMRPLPPPDQDFTTSGRTGKYMVIKRLLPLFEQYSPEQAALLRNEMTALASNVPESDRAEGNRAIDRGIIPDNPKSDPLETMQDRLDHAKTSTERDGIYADVAVALANKGDPKARDLADKIEDLEFKKKAVAYIDFELLRAAFQNKETAKLLRITRTGELTHIQRAWGYAQSAQLTTRDSARAIDYLQEAAAEARRIDGSDPDRARALVAVATGFARTDRVRAWEIITEAVKAANSVESFSGDDLLLSARLQTKNMVVATNASSEDFGVLGVFMALAGDDLYRSIELAKTFTSETARANATIAVARGVLEPKQQKVASGQ